MSININVAAGLGTQATQINSASGVTRKPDEKTSMDIVESSWSASKQSSHPGAVFSSGEADKVEEKVNSKSERNSRQSRRGRADSRRGMHSNQSSQLPFDRLSVDSDFTCPVVEFPVIDTFFVNRLDNSHWNTNLLFKSTLRGGREAPPSLVNQIAVQIPEAKFFRAETRGLYATGGGVLFIWCAASAKEAAVAQLIHEVAVIVRPSSNETFRPGQYSVTTAVPSVKPTAPLPNPIPTKMKRLREGRSLFVHGASQLLGSLEEIRRQLEQSCHRGVVTWLEWVSTPELTLEVQFRIASDETIVRAVMDFIVVVVGARIWSIFSREMDPNRRRMDDDEDGDDTQQSEKEFSGLNAGGSSKHNMSFPPMVEHQSGDVDQSTGNMNARKKLKIIRPQDDKRMTVTDDADILIEPISLNSVLPVFPTNKNTYARSKSSDPRPAT